MNPWRILALAVLILVPGSFWIATFVHSKNGLSATSAGGSISVHPGETQGDSITLIVRPKSRVENPRYPSRTTYLKPEGAIFKLPGCMPLSASVGESDDAFLIGFTVPRHVADALRAGDPGMTSGVLYVPTETSAVAYSGVIHHLPGRASATIQLRPVMTGPAAGLAAKLSRLLHAVY